MNNLLQNAEHALEAGDSARDIARMYWEPADEAGLLRELVKLMQEYDPGTAEHVATEYFLKQCRNGHPAVGSSGAHIVNLADVQPETVRWLWPSRVPLGKLTILDGDPGVLKSTVTLDLAARLSRDDPMPDGSRPDVEGPRGTVLLTAEDGLSDTIRPRLDAAGGDVVRVVALQGIPTEKGQRLPTVDDLEPLREAIEAVDAALIVVDPLVAYLGADVNSYRDQDVRAALAGLADLADETGVAVLAVRHLNKSGGDNPIHRGGGSIGLIAAARSGLLVARDPDAPEGDRRILATTKANLAPEPPALAFRPKVVSGTVAISWEGETRHGARDLLTNPSSEERSAREEATDYLLERLRNGPAPVEELKGDADRLGISWRTFRRAKEGLGIEHFREGGLGADGRWLWRLPANPAKGPGRDNAARGVDGLENGPGGQDERGDTNSYPGHPRDVAENGRRDSLQADLGATLKGDD